MKHPALKSWKFGVLLNGLVVYMVLRAFDVPIRYAVPAMWIGMAAEFAWHKMRPKK